jgi:ribosomal-protein-alanine N-acetyltransferase
MSQLDKHREADFILRDMTEQDIPEVLLMERHVFGSMAWTSKDFSQAVTSKYDYPIVITETLEAERQTAAAEPCQDKETVPDGEKTNASQMRILGYAVLRILGPEAEIENMCVDESARRSGLGQQLMEEMLLRYTTAGAEKVFLEVRSQNEPAKALYEKSGFAAQYIRKNYYRNPNDDAIIMMKLII